MELTADLLHCRLQEEEKEEEEAGGLGDTESVLSGALMCSMAITRLVDPHHQVGRPTNTNSKASVSSGCITRLLDPSSKASGCTSGIDSSKIIPAKCGKP